ncbi:siroheme synthase CysG [Amphritea japonica]|uniref:Siroheme synthase n=1 Tax=Amphritea japonica ATCC BAA-1530 TaxID=1278309 RepID=A0A7R6P445_9GAMM|nr:siroheme synthase CysG [Amphritea japonica]BBB25584.1 uroporphyrin-III C-methyltransferase/precorrin-2 dehydrogenase/sirohydrochlorin ferrochelatase [Amphritea japonica ATCC BAA-1530]
MDYLPLFFKLEHRNALLVGGGQVALRKATLLTRAGARVTVIAHRIDPELTELVEQHGGQTITGEYHSGLLDDVYLVIAATDDDQLNERVHYDAVERHIPVNVVDNQPLCTFIFPAIVDRSPIVIGISSGGESPVLARLLRAKLETWIPQGYSRLGRLVGQFRQQVKQTFTSVERRRIFWEKVLQGQIAEKVFAGRDGEARALLETAIETADPEHQVGEVYLVGGGPGDPELLTFKALRLMQQADVVLFDQLVSPAIVDLCRRDADRIFVGKRRDNHAVPQEGINELLVKYALQGRRVLRLKGGDPFIFGRGGEELETLKQHNIPFQVVPGITAASACSTYAGIPLTHRNYAQSVKLVTGQLKNRTSDLNFAELVHPNQTIVFYMGLHTLPELCEKLVAHGKPPETPAAIVSNGTRAEQKVLTGTLESLPELQSKEKLPAPALIIVGEVVLLHENLAWFGEEVLHNHGLILPDV